MIRKIKMERGKRKGQVWVETVLYTLVGLALIGMILAFALPKITKTQERLLVEQSIGSLKLLDQTISNVAQSGKDNVRIYELSFKDGDLIIDGEKDEIYFEIKDLKDYYSEPNVTVNDGRVNILSYGKSGASTVKIGLNYTEYANILFNGRDVEQKITKAPTSYKIIISNLGRLSGKEYDRIDMKME